MSEPSEPSEPADSTDPGQAPGADDPFAPPAEPVLAHCQHCGQEYMTSEIRYERRGDRGDGARGGDGEAGEERGFWVCPTPGCAGAGFGFDIFPIDGEIEGPGGFVGGWFDDDGNRVPPPWLRGEE